MDHFEYDFGKLWVFLSHDVKNQICITVCSYLGDSVENDVPVSVSGPVKSTVGQKVGLVFHRIWTHVALSLLSRDYGCTVSSNFNHQLSSRSVP